jgi:hypothetical protein
MHRGCGSGNSGRRQRARVTVSISAFQRVSAILMFSLPCAAGESKIDFTPIHASRRLHPDSCLTSTSIQNTPSPVYDPRVVINRGAPRRAAPAFTISSPIGTAQPRVRDTSRQPGHAYTPEVEFPPARPSSRSLAASAASSAMRSRLPSMAQHKRERGDDADSNERARSESKDQGGAALVADFKGMALRNRNSSFESDSGSGWRQRSSSFGDQERTSAGTQLGLPRSVSGLAEPKRGSQAVYQRLREAAKR